MKTNCKQLSHLFSLDNSIFLQLLSSLPVQTTTYFLLHVHMGSVTYLIHDMCIVCLWDPH
jgi:hypothetical protein